MLSIRNRVSHIRDSPLPLLPSLFFGNDKRSPIIFCQFSHSTRSKSNKGYSRDSLTAAAHVSFILAKKKKIYIYGKLSVPLHQKRRELVASLLHSLISDNPTRAAAIGKTAIEFISLCDLSQFSLGFDCSLSQRLSTVPATAVEIQIQLLLLVQLLLLPLLSFCCQVQLCATIHSDLWHCRHRPTKRDWRHGAAMEVGGWSAAME